MTTPGGHGSNDINLAAMWIPVMPETSHMGDEMEKSGKESKRRWEQGFNSGTAPEAMGSSFGSKLTASIGKELKGFELPLGMTSAFDRFGQNVDANVIQKLRGEASQALGAYRSEYDKLTEATGRAGEASNRSADVEGRLSTIHEASAQKLRELIAAQGDAQLSERQLASLRQQSYAPAQVMIPLLREQTEATKQNASAQENLKTAHANTGAALEDYNGKITRLSSVTKEAGSASSLMAGVMGGIAVAAAQQLTGAIDSVVEHIIGGAVEAFKMGIEGAKEFADKMIELGESYEHIGIQITEFSSLSGEAFKNTEEAAQQVFSHLDVAGKNTGQTMAQLATMLDVPGESIKGLVTHVEELQGRFTSLKTTDLASIFVAFKTPAKEADSALASLLQNARNSGQDLGQLTSALSGNVAVTLSEVGLNLQQAGAFMGDLMKLGEPGRQTMTGMTSAMKEFGKEGLTFSEGMKLTGQRLKDLGDTAEGQDLAEKLFGTRNWIVAKNAVQDYLNIVQQGPDAFNASASSLDDFIVRTRTLQNEWEMVKHRAAEAFLPMGESAVKLVGKGLDSLVGYVNQHMDQIKHAVILGGLVFIQFVDQLQKFAEGMLDFFAPVVNGIDTMMGAAIGALGDFATAAGEVISWIPGMHDMGDGLIQAGNGADKFGKLLTGINVGQGMKDISSWLKQHPIDVKGASDSWVNFAENVNTSMDSANSAVGKSQNWFGTAGMPGMPGVGAPASMPAIGIGGTPSGAFPPPGGASPAALDPTGPGAGKHHADWDAIAKLESSNRWNEILSTGVTLGGGLQIKPETWYEFGGLKYSQYAYQATKDQQIEIAERILNGWGSVAGQGPKAWENGSTYVEKKARGGAPGRSISSGSGQGDDVAALLGRGEYVWDTETVDKYGWLIKALHQGATGFGGGGGLDTQGAQLDTIAVAEAAQKLFGINDIGMWRSADGYNEHASGEAADIMVGNNKAAGDAVAQYFLQNATQFGVQYVLWQQAQWNPDGTHSGMSDRGGATQNHLDHVHVRTLGGGFPQGQVPKGFAAPHTGQTSNVPSGVAAFLQGYEGSGGGTMPGGSNGLQFPGMAGQYGGSGVYGGETADSAFSAAQAVQAAQDRAADLDYQVQQNQKKIDDLKAQLAQVGNDPAKVGLLGQPLKQTPAEIAAADQKRKTLNDELDAATHTLTISQRDQSEQGAKVTEAQRKQQEAQYKKPTGASTSSGQSTDAKLGQTLGSGLLAGIGQELGFGDVLGKSPLDWGIVKLASSLFGYANNLGNAVSQATGGGVAGLAAPGGGGMAGGMLSGLAGSLGIPKVGVSSGPNIQPGTPASGQGGGPLPGPPGMVIQGDFQPIHVSPNVDPNAILGPVKENQNATSATLQGQTGGFPQ